MTNMTKNKLIIFDYDGVIADSLCLWINAFEEGGIINNIEYRLDENILAKLDYISMAEIIKDAGLENDERTFLYISDIVNIFKKNLPDVKIFTGIGRLIENLYLAGNIICINTASDSEIVRNRLEYEGLLSFVSGIAGSDMEGSKSDKIIYFMKNFSFSPENTFMIGDSSGDIIEGKKAGVVTIAVTYGWHNESKLLLKKPNYICNNVAELEKIFKTSRN